MRGLQILLVSILAVVVLGAGCTYRGYQRAIAFNDAINEQWTNVEKVLQKRYKLLPDLIGTVESTGQDQELLRELEENRQAYLNADTVAEKADNATRVEATLAHLLAIEETRPEMKTNEDYLKLCQKIDGPNAQRELWQQREWYNETVKRLSAFAYEYPGKLFKKMAGIPDPKFFEPPLDVRMPSPGESGAKAKA